MSTGTQGYRRELHSARLGASLAVAVLMTASLQLSGCTTGAPGGHTSPVDQTLLTGNVPPEENSSREKTSDEITIRNAVSSADLQGAGGQQLAWANSDTGSRGSIEGLEEFKDGGRFCRRFRTSRESFDGIALYKGETCMSGAGLWNMRIFEPL